MKIMGIIKHANNRYIRTLIFKLQIPYKKADRRAGDIASCYADAKLAEQDLGWKAKLDLAKMCKLVLSFVVLFAVSRTKNSNVGAQWLVRVTSNQWIHDRREFEPCKGLLLFT